MVSASAINDLRGIVKYIAREDRETARCFGDQLLNTTQLENRPV